MKAGPIQTAAEHLRQGHVIAYPTEAVWGLGCDPNNEAAVEKILVLKSRPRDKGLLVVAASMEQIEPLLAGLSEEQLARLRASWPGAVTWIIPDPEDLFPDWVRGRHATIAVRVSAHPVVQQLCTAFGGPIVSTSANAAGEAEIRSRQRLEQEFANRVDYIVEGDLGDADKPSSIRDLVSGQVLR